MAVHINLTVIPHGGRWGKDGEWLETLATGTIMLTQHPGSTNFITVYLSQGDRPIRLLTRFRWLGPEVSLDRSARADSRSSRAVIPNLILSSCPLVAFQPDGAGCGPAVSLLYTGCPSQRWGNL